MASRIKQISLLSWKKTFIHIKSLFLTSPILMLRNFKLAVVRTDEKKFLNGRKCLILTGKIFNFIQFWRQVTKEFKANVLESDTPGFHFLGTAYQRYTQYCQKKDLTFS